MPVYVSVSVRACVTVSVSVYVSASVSYTFHPCVGACTPTTHSRVIAQVVVSLCDVFEALSDPWVVPRPTAITTIPNHGNDNQGQ